MEKDVVVIGGGPSGSAAAFTLARAGLDVAILERTGFEGPRVGELLSPDVAASLHWMGVWDTFTADAHVPVRGLGSSWGDSSLLVNDFVCNPFGRGWLVDRARFDRLLLHAACNAGAATLINAPARRCRRDGRWWLVDATRGGHDLSIRSRYIVDATGRARGLRSGTRRRLDRLVACVCHIDDRHADADPGAAAMVESAEDGWWFSAQVPRHGLVLTFLTDADLLPRTADLVAHFWRRLERTATIVKLLPPAPAPHRFYRRPADSQWRPATDANRIAVGDALLSMDPLCGRGVHAAIQSGRLAAEAIVAAEHGDTMAMARCATAQCEWLSTYTTQRREQYSLESRWRHSPFWARRRAH